MEIFEPSAPNSAASPLETSSPPLFSEPAFLPESTPLDAPDGESSDTSSIEGESLHSSLDKASLEETPDLAPLPPAPSSELPRELVFFPENAAASEPDDPITGVSPAVSLLMPDDASEASSAVAPAQAPAWSVFKAIDFDVAELIGESISARTSGLETGARPGMLGSGGLTDGLTTVTLKNSIGMMTPSWSQSSADSGAYWEAHSSASIFANGVSAQSAMVSRTLSPETLG
jgi:hypothetical protein